MFENFISKDGSVFEMLSKISSGYKCPGHTYNLQWEYTNWETFCARNVLRLNFCKSLSLKPHPLKGIVSQNVIKTSTAAVLLTKLVLWSLIFGVSKKDIPFKSNESHRCTTIMYLFVENQSSKWTKQPNNVVMPLLWKEMHSNSRTLLFHFSCDETFLNYLVLSIHVLKNSTNEALLLRHYPTTGCYILLNQGRTPMTNCYLKLSDIN